MFNIGFSEMLVICLVLIIVVGPERLPSMMKTVGKTIRSVRQASRDIQTTVGLDELWREDVLNAPAPPPALPPPPAVVSRESPERVPRVSMDDLTQVKPELPAAVPPPAGPLSVAPSPPVVPAPAGEAPAPAAVAPGGGKGEA